MPAGLPAATSTPVPPPARSGNGRPRRKGRLHRASVRLLSRVWVHVAGRPQLRRTGGRVIKSLGAGIGYATFVEPRWIMRTLVELAVENLPEPLDGYRIAHLTDLHYNVVSGRRFLDRAVEMTNGLDPDMVALTGDFVTHDPARLWGCMESLASLSAPDGLFAVRGNHDYGVMEETFADACRSAGIRHLENNHVLLEPVRHRGVFISEGAPHRTQLVVAGVGDLWMGTADAGRAVAGAPTDAPRILLSHNPLVAEIVTEGHDIALMLSGHTHGGQIRPFGKPVGFFTGGSTKYASGLVVAPHTTVYVSRGVGTSALYARWNCRPEIALITLRRA